MGQDPDLDEVRSQPKSGGEKQKSSVSCEEMNSSDEEKDTGLDPNTSAVRKTSVSSSTSDSSPSLFVKGYKPKPFSMAWRAQEELKKRRKEQKKLEEETAEETQWEDVLTPRRQGGRDIGRTFSTSSLQYSASPARNGEQLVAAYKGKRKKKNKRKFY